MLNMKFKGCNYCSLNLGCDYQHIINDCNYFIPKEDDKQKEKPKDETDLRKLRRLLGD